MVKVYHRIASNSNVKQKDNLIPNRYDNKLSAVALIN